MLTINFSEILITFYFVFNHVVCKMAAILSNSTPTPEHGKTHYIIFWLETVCQFATKQKHGWFADTSQTKLTHDVITLSLLGHMCPLKNNTFWKRTNEVHWAYRMIRVLSLSHEKIVSWNSYPAIGVIMNDNFTKFPTKWRICRVRWLTGHLH